MRSGANPSELTDELKAEALRRGFAWAGVAAAEPSRHMEVFRRWIAEGHHGEMGYLARPDAVERRADLSRTLEGVRSVLVVADVYGAADPEGVPDDPRRAVIARYARGRDYHLELGERLEEVAGWLRSRTSPPARTRVYVDTGPVLERELAQRAGFGWFGKNTMLIRPSLGSYVLLGVLLTDAPLVPDPPFREDRCGSCRACLDACPTGALLGRTPDGAPLMDARLCISYLTIELKGSIPEPLRPLVGNRVFGCDICQEVCPWNQRFAPAEGRPAYAARPGMDGPHLVAFAAELLSMSGRAYRRRFADSPLARPGRRGMLRNVCVALGNWLATLREPPPDAVAVLERAAADGHPLVREHASWALAQAGRDAATGDDA